MFEQSLPLKDIQLSMFFNKVKKEAYIGYQKKEGNGSLEGHSVRLDDLSALFAEVNGLQTEIFTEKSVLYKVFRSQFLQERTYGERKPNIGTLSEDRVF